MLESIMFADDTNLFYLSNDIKTLLLNTKNLELKKISNKTTFTLFHRIQDIDNLPLRLPVLKINDYDTKIPCSIKLHGVLVDENVS